MITAKQSLAIKKKMLEQGTTVTKLAEEFGIQRTFLSGILSGQRNSKEVEQKLKNKYLCRKEK